MIVWNVAERWFALKAEAELYRRGAALKPDQTRRAEIVTREQLADLLNHGTVTLPAAIPKPPKTDPRQIDMFGQTDTQAGLAAIRDAIGAEATRATETEKPADLSTEAKSPLLSHGPDDPDDGRPIERTPTAFPDWDEPDERDMASGKLGVDRDGSRYDLDTGEVL